MRAALVAGAYRVIAAALMVTGVLMFVAAMTTTPNPALIALLAGGAIVATYTSAWLWELAKKVKDR